MNDPKTKKKSDSAISTEEDVLLWHQPPAAASPLKVARQKVRKLCEPKNRKQWLQVAEVSAAAVKGSTAAPKSPAGRAESHAATGLHCEAAAVNITQEEGVEEVVEEVEEEEEEEE